MTLQNRFPQKHRQYRSKSFTNGSTHNFSARLIEKARSLTFLKCKILNFYGLQILAILEVTLFILPTNCVKVMSRQREANSFNFDRHQCHSLYYIRMFFLRDKIQFTTFQTGSFVHCLINIKLCFFPKKHFKVKYFESHSGNSVNHFYPLLFLDQIT